MFAVVLSAGAARGELLKFMEWVGSVAAAMRSEDWPTGLIHQTVSFMATESLRPDKVASMVFVAGAGDARSADAEENRKTWLLFQAKVKARAQRAAPRTRLRLRLQLHAIASASANAREDNDC